MKKKSNVTFRHELFSALALVSIATLLVCSLFTTGFFRGKVDKNYEEEAAESLDNITNALDKFLKKVDDITSKLGRSEDVRGYLYISDSEEKKYLYQALYNLSADIMDHADFALYSLVGEVKYTSNEEAFPESLPTHYGALKRAVDNFDELVISANTEFGSDNFETCLYCSRVLNDGTGHSIGYVIVKVDSDGMDDMLKDSLGKLEKIILLDANFNPIYGSDRQTVKETGLKLKTALMDTGKIYDSGKEDKYYVAKVGNYDMYAVLEQHEIFTEGIARTMYGISSIIALLCLLLCLAVSLVMSKILTKPVEEITKAMQSVGEGNLDVSVKTDRHDEFGTMAENFNNMTGELKENIEERLAAQKELERAHAATMQAQLNPHFLYNTLDTIKWVAKSNNVPEIATMSSGLAKILRTSISGEKSVTLKEELGFVRSYMNIQKIRFSDRFEFVEDVPERYYFKEVPKLIIQPLVENAIVHGFDEGESGRIEIKAFEESESFLITVTDNGRGISEEMLEAINSHNGKALEGHHGVHNVDTIIRLHYGIQYGVSAECKVRNDSGEGYTVMTIRLPLEGTACIK